MVDIKYKQLNRKATIPVRGSEDAACYDLIITSVEVNNNLATIRYGFATEIPKGFKAVIVPRSSFTHKGWVMQNSPGQIDSDYRGEWMSKFEAIPTVIREGASFGIANAGAYYLGYPEFPYRIGDRVTQFSIDKVIPIKWTEEELETSKRGDGGFGSTDNN